MFSLIMQQHLCVCRSSSEERPGSLFPHKNWSLTSLTSCSVWQKLYSKWSMQSFWTSTISIAFVSYKMAVKTSVCHQAYPETTNNQLIYLCLKTTTKHFILMNMMSLKKLCNRYLMWVALKWLDSLLYESLWDGWCVRNKKIISHSIRTTITHLASKACCCITGLFGHP